MLQGQTGFKSLPRMGRRTGDDFISGRPTLWNGYRPNSVPNRKTPYELASEPRDANWDYLLYGNRNTVAVSPENRMVFAYDPTRGIHSINTEKESPIEYSNGVFSLNNDK